jgi:hypothetical protein
MNETTTQTLESLNHTFSKQDVTMSLTEAGLLVDRAEAVVRLYAKHHNWGEVKERWHEERVHERGSRSSAQRIFRIIKRRLQAGGNALPSVSTLDELIRQCPTTQAKAQLLYFYLIQEDDLFRFVLHEVLRIQGPDRDQWDLSPDRIASILRTFQYADGSELSYAKSTLERWVQGFRSVLRDIGVIKRPYDDEGTVPTVDFPPLHVGALYSWTVEGRQWPERPIGWLYLFQSSVHRDALFDRLQSSDGWMVSQLRDQTVLTPVESERRVS